MKNAAIDGFAVVAYSTWGGYKLGRGDVFGLVLGLLFAAYFVRKVVRDVREWQAAITTEAAQTAVEVDRWRRGDPS